MNRRDFLVRSSLLTAAGFLVRAKGASGAASPQASSPPTEFRPLRRDVGLFTGRGGTIGWLANQDALVAVDTQFPDTASAFLAGMPRRERRQLDVVINTHHHPDHTSGNGVFKPAAKTIVAHANVPKLQMERAERDNSVNRQVFADTTFDRVWQRELGGEIVSAQYFGPAHTNGDAVIAFEKAQVVHMGDLMFNRLYPVIDRAGGASIRGWIGILEEVAKTYPADTIFVFGHGNAKFGVTGRREDLLVFRDYLSGLLDHVQKKIKAGEPKEKIVALENLPGFDDYHLPLPNRLGGNLSVAYDELTAGKG